MLLHPDINQEFEAEAWSTAMLDIPAPIQTPTIRKQHWAKAVLGWETSWELLFLLAWVQISMILRGE